jgi:hypothetical protein
MLLSIYTYFKDVLFYDLHAVEMLLHHLPLADEIVVNEGYSKDGTYERICNLDPKIKVQRRRWDQPPGTAAWYLDAKDTARQMCHGEWCFHLDADEFVPEWEFAEIRRYLASAKEDLIPIQFLNFYGNYKVIHARPDKTGWPGRKMILHRNRPDIEFWGDGANVRLKGQRLDWGTSPPPFTVHHFGAVRDPARLRQKWHIQGGVLSPKRRWYRLPAFLFNWRPHQWHDPQFMDDLQPYEGPYVQAVREKPEEFVRDSFEMYNYVKKRAHQGTGSDGLLRQKS